MADVWIMGEMIVEIMRTAEDVPLDREGVFRGPFPSGAPAIFIDTVARMGHRAGIIGGVGEDDFGKCLLRRLEKDGVDCSHVDVSEACATGVAFVTYFFDGSRKFIYHMGNTPAVEAKAPDISALEGVKYFHIMGCSLMANSEFAKEIVKTMKMAKRLKAKISFDPNIRKELFADESINHVISEVMENTNIFLPGVEELRDITKKDSVEEAVEKSFENPELEIIVLKNGSKGSCIYTREQAFEVGAFSADQVDATGAGDCFDGAFISGLLDGKDPEDAAKMGAAAGALNVQAFGPMEGEINPENIRKLIKRD